jgi:mycoredoxin
MPSKLKVYGADWCEDTTMTREQLDRLGIQYEYINVDQNPAAQEWVKKQNGGKQKTPTVELDGKILVEPDEAEMVEALNAAGMMK